MRAVTCLPLAACALLAGFPVVRPSAAPEHLHAPVSEAASQDPATGSGEIGGRIVEAQTGRPLGGALVRLSASEPWVARYVTTDVAGEYRFRALAPATYRLRASRAAYLDTQYGEDLTTGEAPRTIALAEGKVLEDVDIRLPKGAVITGRIADVFGDPVPGVRVQVVVVADPDLTEAVPRPLPLPARTSDDLGQYRLFGILPGDYYVVAGFGKNVAPGLQADGTRAGANRTSSLSFPAYAPGSDPRLAAPEAVADYGETYHPGVPSVATAGQITVRAGEEVGGIDIHLIPAALKPPVVIPVRR